MTTKVWSTENTINHGIGVDYDSITMLPTGGYVVTWRENNRIAFQLYDGNGTQTGDTRFVEQPQSGLPQQFSDVFSYDPDGGFVITWTEGTGTTGRVLRNQKFTVDGSANGAASTLNTTTLKDGAQTSADVAGQWATTYIETQSRTVRLIQNGQVVDVAFGSAVDQPDVAYIGVGHVVSYLSEANGTISFKIVKDGAAQNLTTIAGASRADVVALKDPGTGLLNGNFAVVVEKKGSGTEAHLYTSSGAPLTDSNGNAIVVNIGGPKPYSTFDCVGVTSLKNGGFAVAYIAADGADLGDVYVRVVDANGVAGQAVKVNARAAASNGSQQDPKIWEMADGRLAVSWIDGAISDGSAPSILSSTILDFRTSKIKVTGTTHDDIYAPSEYAGDDLDGGAGFDTLTFKGASSGVAVDLVAGNGSAGDAAGDTYKNFEKVIGTNFNDTLAGGAGHVLVGGAGNDIYGVSASDTVIDESGGGYDQVYASASYVLSAGIEDLIATGTDAINLTGNASNNTVLGNEADNQLQGLGGNDVLRGNGGNDTLYGGDGEDDLGGGDGNDILDGGAGIDILDGGIGNDGLYGGDGNDSLFGGEGSDTLDGGNGDDWMNGGAGADVMKGGDGNDTYIIDDVNDVIYDTSGVDTVYLYVDYDVSKLDGIENITGAGSASITLKGNAANNTLIGNDGANILYGGAGNDVLRGGAGNDRIHGEAGRDILYGDAGRDIFVFDTPLSRSKSVNRANIDKIADYNVRDDSIYMENKVFKALGKQGSLAHPKAIARGFFHVGAQAHDANDHIIYNKKTGALYYDADGTGHQAQIQIATLSKNLKMNYHDFFVI